MQIFLTMPLYDSRSPGFLVALPMTTIKHYTLHSNFSLCQACVEHSYLIVCKQECVLSVYIIDYARAACLVVG